MSKYAMLNCWNDLNKGDLGIMLATVNEFRRQDPGCEIIGISCFTRYDISFDKGHTILKRYVPDIYPAIFGTLGLKIGHSLKKDIASKLVGFVLESIRYRLCLIAPNGLAMLFLTKEEKKTLNAIRGCDVAFSKGGSVFTDYNSRRGTFALIRLCRFYQLLNKFGVNYYILAQSFGPVSSKKGIKAVNWVIDGAQKVFLREYECVQKYSSLHLNNEKVRFSNDAGFLIEPEQVDPNPIDRSTVNVGITIRGKDGDENYLKEMANFISHIVTNEKATIHIFKQVAMDSEPDNVATEKILKRLKPDVLKNVIWHKEKNYLPQELCWLYGEMDYFVGTRLHSTIFAMRVGTPAIGIVYHGTKTQGIFKNIGVEELVVENPVTLEKLIEKYDLVTSKRDYYCDRIKEGVTKARKQAKDAVGDIIRYAHEGKQ